MHLLLYRCAIHSAYFVTSIEVGRFGEILIRFTTPHDGYIKDTL